MNRFLEAVQRRILAEREQRLVSVAVAPASPTGGRERVPDARVAEVRRRHAAGEGPTAIAEALGVTVGAVKWVLVSKSRAINRSEASKQQRREATRRGREAEGRRARPSARVTAEERAARDSYIAARSREGMTAREIATATGLSRRGVEYALRRSREVTP